jgi:hypothetical protein
MTKRQPALVFLLLFSIGGSLYASEDKSKTAAAPPEARGESTPEKSDAAQKPTGPDWMVVVTPTGGWLNNETTFRFSVPMGDETREQTATLKDDGWGLGFTVMGYYKWVSLTNVFFYFPEVNQSSLVGNVTYLSVSIPTGTFVEPYFGLGLVFVSTATDYRDFHYADTIGGLKGYADFERMSIDNFVFTPFPKVGVKFKLPLQHWYITPFYSYMYEYVDIRAKSSGGSVEVYDESGNLLFQPEVDPFDTKLHKDYHSHLVGANFFLDYNYFLQLRGKVYYNTNHNLWTVRAIGSFLFSKYVGLSVYLEYSEKITVKNLYILVGPAFVFSPPGFMDKMMARRNAKMKRKGKSDSTP